MILELGQLSLSPLPLYIKNTNPLISKMKLINRQVFKILDGLSQDYTSYNHSSQLTSTIFFFFSVISKILNAGHFRLTTGKKKCGISACHIYGLKISAYIIIIIIIIIIYELHNLCHLTTQYGMFLT